MHPSLTHSRSSLHYFKPAVERLEERCVLSLTYYTNYSIWIYNLDGSQSQQYETFHWDSMASSYNSAWSAQVSACNETHGVVADITTAQNSDSGDEVISGTAIDNLWTAESSAFSNESSAQDNVTLLAVGQNSAYTDSSGSVAIDPSVTNLATAKSRVNTLLSIANAVGARQKTIQDAISGSGTIVGVAKVAWYAGEVGSNHQAMKNAIKEINLIKTAYPAAFK